MSKHAIVHHRWLKHLKGSAIVVQVTDCYHAGNHLSMSDDWSAVTCKNCVRCKRRDPPRETFHVESG